MHVHTHDVIKKKCRPLRQVSIFRLIFLNPVSIFKGIGIILLYMFLK